MEKEEIISRLNMAVFWQSETGAALQQGENLIKSPLRDNDRNPSFSINTNTGLWHDFGTGDGGDVFSYVMIKHGLAFPGAVQYVGRYTGAVVTRPKPPAKEKPIRHGTRENYGILEIVKQDLRFRGHFEARTCTPDYFGTPGARENYHSMYWHCGEIETYHKEHGNLKGYRGPVFCREMFFDIDFKDGTKEENIGRAFDETRKLIQKIKGFGISTFSIKFSGNKGAHISFSCPALDEISGYVDTPERVKRLAGKLAAGINGIDFSIYTTTHLVRSANSINGKSGLFAIPLTEAEIYTLSPEEIITLARSPRPKPAKYEPVKAYSKLLDEPFTIDRGNDAAFVTFESGAIFTKKEIETLRGEKDKSAIKAIFNIKKSFGGNVEKDAEKWKPKN
jgi:hypothetical protein